MDCQICRPCEVQIYVDGKLKTVAGVFHQWGFDSLEGNDGNNLMWSVGIVELEDGSIVLPHPSLVKFTDRERSRLR